MSYIEFNGESKCMGFTVRFYTFFLPSERKLKFCQISSGDKLLKTIRSDYMNDVKLYLDGYVNGIKEGIAIRDGVFKKDLKNMVQSLMFIGKNKSLGRRHDK